MNYFIINIYIHIEVYYLHVLICATYVVQIAFIIFHFPPAHVHYLISTQLDTTQIYILEYRFVSLSRSIHTEQVGLHNTVTVQCNYYYMYYVPYSRKHSRHKISRLIFVLDKKHFAVLILQFACWYYAFVL